MKLEMKNKWRLRFKIAAVGMVFGVLVAGIVIALVSGTASGFTGIAGAVCTFATGVFGVDYFSSPVKGEEDGK